MKTQIFVIFLAAVSFFGCKKFLDVNPKSTVSERELFTSEVGFQQSLTGIYSQIASQSMYGDHLTMGFVSALGQNYNPANAFFRFKQTTALNFTSSEVVNNASAIWRSAYNAIAGLNNILTHIDAKQQLFTGNNYSIVKGEALGLRANIHFDLLRLFGYSVTAGADKKAIPYRTQLNATSQVPATTAEVLAAVIHDLNEAEDLLKDKDMILQGQKDRRFYMNYMAVKGLQARVYLYMNDKDNALKAAGEVVNANVFTFVTQAQISAGPATRDRLFSNEQVFSLRVRNIKDWVESITGYFKSAGDVRDNLTRTAAHFNTLYETSTGGSTDYRFVYLLENDGSTLFPSKYWQTWAGAGANLNETVPLIRLSEMYYILAETAATPAEGAQYLNEVRKHRGLALLQEDISAEKLKEEITKEYQKEFLGEGQLFYYYKRTETKRMLFGSKDLAAQNYVIPVPESELEYNPNYK